MTHAEIDVLTSVSEPFPLSTSRLLYDAPPVSYLIDGIIPTHSICGITGAPGTGKTWYAMEAMRAVVTGSKFLGQFQAQQGPVLFVGNDSSYHDYARQWRRLTLEASEEYDALAVQNPFMTYAHFLLESDFNFDDPAMVGRIIRTSMNVERKPYEENVLTDDGWEVVTHEGRHYALIIYDAFWKFTASPDSDNVARGLVFNHVRQIAAATGAALMILHHPPLTSEYRTGEEWRGAGLGALDVHQHLVIRNKRPDTVEVKTKKFRGITPRPFLMNLNVFADEKDAELVFIESTKTVTDYDTDIMKLLVAFLKENKAPANLRELADAVFSVQEIKTSYKTVTRVMNRIRNLLTLSTMRPDCPIVKISYGNGRAALFKLKEETNDAE